MFFGFNGLVQSLRIAAPLHHAASEFVNDNNFVIFNDVIFIEREQFVGAQCILNVMHNRNIASIVKSFAFEDSSRTQHLL